MKPSLTNLPKNSFEIKITIPKAEVEIAREGIIAEAVKTTEIPGFRKGSAPKDRVESSLDQSKIYEEVIQRLVPRFYVEAIKELGLKPILNPKIQLSSAKEGEDLSFVATSCQRPEVVLGDFKKEVRNVVSGLSKEISDDRDKKLNKIIDHLLSMISIDPADLLIEEEANHSLARLIDQTQQLGISVEQYLASVGKSAEILKAEYATGAKRNLQVEFLLDAIAANDGVNVEDKEIDEVIAATADPESKKNLSSPSQRGSIKAILTRRHVLDSLIVIS